MAFAFEAPPEQLGAFYIGAEVDPTGEPVAPLHLDARDLTTHAICIGMTGSGKTGLCVDLLEEAALDGVPAIIIDPKGDMGNLLLHFPALRAQDFLPWINADDADRKGLTMAAYAEHVASTWAHGLGQWGVGSARVGALARSVDFQVFTPGSTSVQPLNVLGRLQGPDDPSTDELHERSSAIASALLGLVGIDPGQAGSRELTFIAVLVEHFWSSAMVPEIGDLIRAIPDPPVRRFGVFDVDSFFPESERYSLAMRFNSLLASPKFSAWLEGPPLNIDSLLFSPEGKPRHSVLYIAHLSDRERMFFVTLLLETLLSWMRRQPGTTSLRAILYFDEILGFLPPVANPPSKRPILTILKQGRAFGLGALLATQNPVDLDYKALSNAGTWLIGRLQSEQDQRRLLDGLGSTAAAATGGSSLAEQISRLAKRMFVLHSVHEEQPVVFQSRWAMNYLRGPLTRRQLALFQSSRAEKPIVDESGSQHSLVPAPSQSARFPDVEERPALPKGVREAFLLNPKMAPNSASIPFVAGLGAQSSVRYVNKKYGVDITQPELLLIEAHTRALDWAKALTIPHFHEFLTEGDPSMRFSGSLPPLANTSRKIAVAQKDLAEFLYRNRSLELKVAPELDVCQRPGEADASFFARVQQAAREKRDEDLDNLIERYRPRIERLEDRLRRKELDVADREAALQGRQQEEWLRLGESVLGVVLGGRRPRASSTVSRRRMTAAARQRLERALREADDIREEINEFRAEIEEASEEIRRSSKMVGSGHETLRIEPRRVDIAIEYVGVLWYQP